MEKYGVEKVDETKDNDKLASEIDSCEHPEESLEKDNGAVFCNKCGKYLGVINDKCSL